MEYRSIKKNVDSWNFIKGIQDTVRVLLNVIKMIRCYTLLH